MANFACLRDFMQSRNKFSSSTIDKLERKLFFAQSMGFGIVPNAHFLNLNSSVLQTHANADEILQWF